MNEIRLNELLNKIYYEYLDSHEAEEFIIYFKRLKKENERLKENAEHNDKVVDKARWNEMIYKSRCEKANQYIKKNTHEYKMFNEELGHFSNLTNISIDKNNKVFINDLLKILGGDE